VCPHRAIVVGDDAENVADHVELAGRRNDNLPGSINALGGWYGPSTSTSTSHAPVD
jgi:hypothetical protein